MEAQRDHREAREARGAAALESAPIWIAAAIALGVLARLGATLWLWHHGAKYPDENQYWQLAQRIRAGGGLSNPFSNMHGIVHGGEATAMWGLVFPYFLAGCQTLFGGRLLAVRLVVGQFSWLLLCWAMLGYTRGRWSERRRAALVALMAVHPNLVYLDSFLMTESLFIPLTALVLWLGWEWRRRAQRGEAGAARSLGWGAAYGGLHLVRMNLAPFQLLQLGQALRRRPTRRMLALGGLSLLASGAVLAPWLLRNHHHYGVWAIETKSGFNLLLMNDPAQAPTGLDQLNEAQRDAAYERVAVAWIESHPAAFARLCERRLLEGWALAPVTLRLRPPAKAAVEVYTATIYLLLLLGGWLSLRRRRWGDAVALVIYATALMTFTNAAFRHRSYAEPFILLLAVEGAASAWGWASLNRGGLGGGAGSQRAEDLVPDAEAF